MGYAPRMEVVGLMFGGIFKGKKVLITGNTGFKGSWLSIWLHKLGAEVHAVSVDVPTEPSNFRELNLESRINHTFLDIREFNAISDLISAVKPDFIFHLAAQSIVSTSYKDPLRTIGTNILGTSHVLESLRLLNHECVAVIITSDKCYDNVEWVWGYKETDRLGGKDIYSGSKGGAELVFNSYYHSFFRNENSNVKLATARAGNVIGGGDWAQDRIVPDCVRSWSKGEAVTIRNPYATRPWQHVLEPLSGYLTLALTLHEGKIGNGESFNFGPPSEQNVNVQKLIEDLSKHWNFNNKNDSFSIVKTDSFHEAGLLKLNCDKALFHLNWKPVLNYEQLITFVGKWYYKYYKGQTDMFDYTIRQIEEYQIAAKEVGLTWSR